MTTLGYGHAKPPDSRTWSARRSGAVLNAISSAGRTLLAGLIAASAVGVAEAYYPSTGVGSGSGGTSTVGALTLSPGTLSDSLYPGDTAQVTVTATNPNLAEVRIGSLLLDTSQGTGGFARASGSASCGLTAFSFATQTNGGEGWTVPGRGALSIALPDAVAASATTSTACQGTVLTVYLKASG